MSILFIFLSIAIIVLLIKCIYQNLDKPQEEEEKKEEEKPKPPPTLEETLISLLKYFKEHIHQMTVYEDRIVIYCFKNSPNDDVSQFNEIKIRFCDIGFKSIPNDECKPLQDKLAQAINPPPQETKKEDIQENK